MRRSCRGWHHPLLSQIIKHGSWVKSQTLFESAKKCCLFNHQTRWWILVPITMIRILQVQQFVIYRTPAQCASLKLSCPACFVLEQPHLRCCYCDSCIGEPPYLRIAASKWTLISGESHWGYHRWMLSFFHQQWPGIINENAARAFWTLGYIANPPMRLWREKSHASRGKIHTCKLDDSTGAGSKLFWAMNIYTIPAYPSYLLANSILDIDEARKSVRQLPWFCQTGYCTWLRCDWSR